MKKFIGFLILLVCLCQVAGAAPTVTVTATSTTLLGTTIPISLNCALVDPNQTGALRTGTTVITVPVVNSTTPGVTATCGPLWGNDVVTDAFGNASTSYYLINVYTVTNGIIASSPAVTQAYQFAGSGTFDLSSTLPFSLGPVSPAGSVLGQNLTFTGNNSFSGNDSYAGTETFTGALNANGAGTGLAVANNETVGGTLGVTGALTVTQIIIAGETVSHAPRGAFSGSAISLTSTGRVMQMPPDKAVTVTSISYTVPPGGTLGTGCSQAPQVRVTDGTTLSSTLTLTNGTGSGSLTGLSANYAAGADLRLEIAFNASGCGANWANVNFVVQFKMQ